MIFRQNPLLTLRVVIDIISKAWGHWVLEVPILACWFLPTEENLAGCISRVKKGVSFGT
jgi:hypothetical protein